MPSSSLYPVWLDMTDLPVLLVGGGKVSLRKAKGLMDAGARVTVVSPRFQPAFLEWEGEGKIVRIQEEYKTDHLDGQVMVFACTDDPELNTGIVTDARGKGLWAASATECNQSNLYSASVVRRGKLAFSISSEGTAPILVRTLRECLERFFGENWCEITDRVGKARRVAAAAGDLDHQEIASDIHRAFTQSAKDYINQARKD